MALARYWYEHPAIVALGPLLSSLAVGFAVVGPWGEVYLTAMGREYLEGAGT